LIIKVLIQWIGQTKIIIFSYNLIMIPHSHHLLIK